MKMKPMTQPPVSSDRHHVHHIAASLMLPLSVGVWCWVASVPMSAVEQRVVDVLAAQTFALKWVIEILQWPFAQGMAFALGVLGCFVLMRAAGWLRESTGMLAGQGAVLLCFTALGAMGAESFGLPLSLMLWATTICHALGILSRRTQHWFAPAMGFMLVPLYLVLLVALMKSGLRPAAACAAMGIGVGCFGSTFDWTRG